MLLCTTLRHIYRSKHLTTILSRMGQCETYDFGLELVTALAKALDNVSPSLTHQIITGEGNDVFHLEWDNLKNNSKHPWLQLGEQHWWDHDTGGETRILYQPRSNTPFYKRSNTPSLKVDTPETLAHVHIYSRVGPKFPERAVFTPPATNNEVYSKYIQEYRVWLLTLVVGSSGENVPGFG